MDFFKWGQNSVRSKTEVDEIHAQCFLASPFFCHFPHLMAPFSKLHYLPVLSLFPLSLLFPSLHPFFSLQDTRFLEVGEKQMNLFILGCKWLMSLKSASQDINIMKNYIFTVKRDWWQCPISRDNLIFFFQICKSGRSQSKHYENKILYPTENIKGCGTAKIQIHKSSFMPWEQNYKRVPNSIYTPAYFMSINGFWLMTLVARTLKF